MTIQKDLKAISKEPRNKFGVYSVGRRKKESTSGINKTPLDNLVGDSKFIGKALDVSAVGHVFGDQIVGIKINENFSGHVYNLQTMGGSYIAQNIIVGNCRCSLLPWLPEFAEEQ